MDETIRMKPIGRVVSPVQEMVDENWGGVVSKVLLLPEYAGGLDGLDGFSHVMVATYLDQARYEPVRHLKRRPRGLESMPLLGIFAQRAKHRPNPIGITTVKLIRTATDHIEVQGLDAVDGTPVLDIKPYFPMCDRIENPRTPDWVAELMKDYF